MMFLHPNEPLFNPAITKHFNLPIPMLRHEINLLEKRQTKINYIHRYKIEKVKVWIHDNYHQEDITITTLAEVCHLSRFHFIRVFKEVFGKSPYDYLIEVRVGYAMQLLKKNSYRNIEEISLAVGFRSPAQLRYHFKRLRGKLPSKF